MNRRDLLRSGLFAAAAAPALRASPAAATKAYPQPSVPAPRSGPLPYRPVVTPNGTTLPHRLVDGVQVLHLVAERLFDRSGELNRLSADHEPVIQLSGADEVTRPQHPRNLRILPGSRDFH